MARKYINKKKKNKENNLKEKVKNNINTKIDEVQSDKITENEIKKENKPKRKIKNFLTLKKHNDINKEKLEKIEEEIKKQTTIPKEKKDKINKKIFHNIIIAVIIVLYFIFINLGFYNIEPLKFLKDLQVFSIITIVITIVIFEKAYKKDDGEIAIYGIESLIVSICTLMTIYIGMKFKDKFDYIINTIAILFAIYYVGKSIVICYKMKKEALKRVSDIHKIGRVK